MIYHDFQGDRLSALGLGCMRLPVLDGDDARPDPARVREMVAFAMERGVNYYDTAWGYHGGNSELIMGETLSAYPRESFYLASKFPGYSLSNMPKVREIFARQLEKCRVEYFDYYLFHNVCEMNVESYLDPRYGILDHLLAQKKAGRIRHLGFSAHGGPETIRRFLDAYGAEMEFCQLQLNYLDYEFQDGREKLALLRERDIPVWVMEPLRGGKLAALRPEYAAPLRALRPPASDAEWAFRFLQSLPEVRVTLSGMSDMAQLRENIRVFETEAPLNETEMRTVLRVAGEMAKVNTVPCTACRYCADYCPMELDIPALLKLYNEHALSGGGFIAPMALRAYPEEKRPAACIGCRSCEAVCPQGIRISEAMADFVRRLER